MAFDNKIKKNDNSLALYVGTIPITQELPE